MNFKSILNRIKNEPEWAVLIGLLVLLVVAGGAFFYYRSQNRSQAARRDFRQANSVYLQASQTGQYERAVKVLRRYINDHPSAVQTDKVHFFLGKSLFENGNYIEAIRQFKKLQKKFPDSIFAPSAQLHIGYANAQRGAPEKALDSYRRAISEYSEAPVVKEARWQQALVNLEMDRQDVAERHLRELTESSSNEESYWVDWAHRLRSRLASESG
jgi:TolA-binding protein